jgi:hypothetical protein
MEVAVGALFGVVIVLLLLNLFRTRPVERVVNTQEVPVVIYDRPYWWGGGWYPLWGGYGSGGYSGGIWTGGGKPHHHGGGSKSGSAASAPSAPAPSPAPAPSGDSGASSGST